MIRKLFSLAAVCLAACAGPVLAAGPIDGENSTTGRVFIPPLVVADVTEPDDQDADEQEPVLFTTELLVAVPDIIDPGRIC